MKNSLTLSCLVLALFTLLVSCKKEDEQEIVTVNMRVTLNNAPVTNVDVGATFSLEELDNNSYQHKQATNSVGEAAIQFVKKYDLYFEVETFINGKPYYGKTHVSTLSSGKNIPQQEIKLAEARILPKQIVQTKGNSPNTYYFDLIYQYDELNRLIRTVRKDLIYVNSEEYCTFTYYPDGNLKRIDYGHSAGGSNKYVTFMHRPDMVVADYNFPGGLSSRIVDSIYFGPNGLPLISESFDIDHSNFNTVSNFNYSGNNFLSSINEFYPNSPSNHRAYYYTYDFSPNPFFKDRNAILMIKYGFRPVFLDEWGGVTPKSLSYKDGSASVRNSYSYFNNLPDSVSTKTGFNSTEWVKQKVYYCWR